MTKDEALNMSIELMERFLDYDGISSSDYIDVLDACKEALDTEQVREDLPAKEFVVDGNTSDGYHTFNELYEFRKAYNAALFNELSANNKCSVHKSWRHHNGELCFGGGWFIVVAVLPSGQISNHYEAKDWDLFKIKETDKAMFEFDGHTGIDVIDRLTTYSTHPHQWQGLTDDEREILYDKAIEMPLANLWNDYAYLIEQALRNKND